MAGQIALTVGSAVAGGGALAARGLGARHALPAPAGALGRQRGCSGWRRGNLHISATFLAVVLAMTLLGPTPAAALGVTTYPRQRDQASALRGARRSRTCRPSRSSRSSAACCSRRSAASSLLTGQRGGVRARGARRLPVDERPQLPADRDRHRDRRRAGGRATASGRSTCRSRRSSSRSACSPPASPSPTSGDGPRGRRPARGRRADLPVPAPHRRSTRRSARRSSRAGRASSPRSRSGCSARSSRRSRCATR